MYKFCHYKYLLNLPGHQPWSYRLMNILKMGSMVNTLEKGESNYKGDELWACLNNKTKSKLIT